MSRLALVTIAIGSRYAEIAAITHPSLAAYAARIGADFRVITDADGLPSPHFAKFRGLYDLLAEYDRVIYADTDIIVRPDCPNLFEMVPDSCVGAYNEAWVRDLTGAYEPWMVGWRGAYHNTGVMVMASSHRVLFEPFLGDAQFAPPKGTPEWYDQDLINYRLMVNCVPSFSLPLRYNRMGCMDPFLGDHRLSSFIIHYAGYSHLPTLPAVIAHDLHEWEVFAPDYDFGWHMPGDLAGGFADSLGVLEAGP
jgi:hypothetical protein